MTGDPDSIGGAALRGHHRTIHDGSSVSRLFAEGLRGAAMIDARVQDLLNEVGLKPSPGVQATIAGRDPVLAYRFPVGEAAAVALAACGVAVSNLWELRGGRPQRARVEVLRAAASLHSRDYLSLNGGPAPLSPASGNPLVDLYRCRDGRWVHVHGTLPNLAYGTMKVLGCSRERESVAAAVARWDGQALEDRLAEAGQCGAMVRTVDEWAAHPQGRSLADRPRVEITKLGESDPEPLPTGERPLSGVRVLDLTRILAGPTHARTLAEHGADVLYVASPWLPNLDAFVMDTNHGKLSAYLDLDEPDDAARLRELVSQCDVFAQGYRAGALVRRGFGPDELSRARLALSERDVVRPPRRDLRSGPGERDRRSGGAVRRDGHALRSAPTSQAGPRAVGDAAPLGPANRAARKPPAGVAGPPLGRLRARIRTSHRESG